MPLFVFTALIKRCFSFIVQEDLISNIHMCVTVDLYNCNAPTYVTIDLYN